jgi:sporulation protein YlmC with PRC-barrel domain
MIGIVMKAFIAAAALAVVIAPAFAQQPAPAPTTAGPARICTDMPAETTVNNFYKQSVYDPSDNKIGDVEDVLIDTDGHVSAMIIAVGGFLGVGEKDVAVPYSSIRASKKNNKWYLVLNTTKDALKTAPGFTYDKTKTAWIPAVK